MKTMKNNRQNESEKNGRASYLFDEWEFKSQTCQLLRQSQPVKMRSTSARLLLELLKSDHQVLEKSNLIAAVWPDTHVTENALTQGVKELRKILDDDAQEPVYIRTHSGVGYQWLQQTTRHEPQSNPAIESKRIDAENRPRSSKWLFGILALVIAYFFMDRVVQKPSTNEASVALKRLAILPFENRTNNPDLQWLELGLSDMLTRECQNLPFLSTFTREDFYSAIAGEMADGWEPESVQSFLANHKTDLLITAYVEKQEQHYEFNYTLYRMNDSEIRGRFVTDQLTACIPLIVERLALQLGATESKNAKPALSGNDEANADYAKAMAAFDTQGAALARPYLEAALVRDPNFRWARAQLANAYFQAGDWDQVEQIYHQIFDRPSSNLAVTVFIEGLMADVLARKGETKRASSILNSQWQRVSDFQSDVLKHSALMQQANILLRQGKLKDLARVLDEAEAMAIPASTLEHQADTLFFLGNPQLSQRNNIECFADLQQSADYYQAMGLRAKLARTLLVLGSNDAPGLNDRRAYLTQAITILRELDHKPDLALALASLGYLESNNGQLNSAQQLLSEAESIAQSMGATSTLAKIQFFQNFVSLARCFPQPQDDCLMGVADRMQSCLHLFNQQEAATGTLDCLLFLTLLDLEFKQYEQAIDRFEKMDALVATTGDSLTYSYVLLLKGKMFLDQNRLGESRTCLDQIPEKPALPYYFAQLFILDVLALVGSGNQLQAHINAVEKLTFPAYMRPYLNEKCSTYRVPHDQETVRSMASNPSILEIYFQPLTH